MPKNEKIQKMRGETWHREVTVEDPSTGNLRSLANFRIWFTMKLSNSDQDSDAIIYKRWRAGVADGLQPVDYTDPKTGLLVTYGRCSVDITQEDLDLLEYEVEYFWDLQVVTPEGSVLTQHNGTFVYNEEDTTHDTD